MAEHADLVREMVDLEKMPSTERLKLARGRRQKQVGCVPESGRVCSCIQDNGME